jgi:hypothetical protein
VKLSYFSAGRVLDASQRAVTPVPAATMLRPFLDLTGPGDPINARTCHHAGERLLDDLPDMPPQGNTRAGFRDRLVAENGLCDHVAAHPADLAPGLRGPAWQRLADDLAEWPALSGARRLKVVTALNKLSYNAVTLEIVPQVPAAEIAADEEVALLELKRASAASKQRHALDAIEERLALVARYAPRGRRAAFAAAINLTVHHARATGDRAATIRWADEVQAGLRRLRPVRTGMGHLLVSTALRAASFGPYMRRQPATVTAMLAEADEYAQALFDQGVPRVLAEENLYALLETQVNVARWTGDRALAHEYAGRLVELDPFEPRGRLQQGDLFWDDGRIEEAVAAFTAAALLGTPVTAVAWFCVGRGRERLGDLVAARDAYANSLTADAHGLSALVRLRGVALRLGDHIVAEWATARLNRLHRKRLAEDGENRRAS